ncbi:HotDog domain-containing protein [Xylaria sp. CBS 124048]|nr:HotDog domain-containing protein [Xylaria sp. CBS 124048]
MSVALRTLRGRTLTYRPTRFALRPVISQPVAYRLASSFAAPAFSLVRRTLKLLGFAVVFGTFGFLCGAYPSLPFSMSLLNPPTDEESLSLYKPQTEEERDIDNAITNHPLAKELRAKHEFSESRPHMKIPEQYRTRHLTGGLLTGPGRVVVPPLVFAEDGGKSMVAISYLGSDLCGHPGIIHGGLLATMLDEGLARCCFPALPHKLGLTANLNINYRAPAKADSYVVLRATTTKVEGRKAWVEGRIETLVSEGETPVVLAEATALFVSPKQAAVRLPVLFSFPS